MKNVFLLTMKSSRYLYWGAQVLGWLLYGILIFLAFYVEDPKEINSTLFLHISSFIAFAILSTHLMRQLFFKWNWLEMKLPPLIPRIITASIVCGTFIASATTITSIAMDRNDMDSLSFLKILIEILANTVLILFWNALYFTYHFFSKSRKQELNNLSLEASRNEIELKNLRTQLNPHFLFNSLNSIRALIELEPVKAKNSVTALSNLLRKSLMMGKHNLVSLSDEIEMVSNYLDLEKIRFEERLVIKWDLDESIHEFMIPPFSIQMLVENAIKHGISNLIKGGEIYVKTKKNDESIVITVENSGTLKKEVDLGIGIENTRRRLDLQYNGNANFDIRQEGTKVISSITFKH